MLSKFQPQIVGLALLGLFLLLAWQLRERDLEFIFEADFQPGMIEAWRRFFAGEGVAALPVPIANPYLDGQFIVYGLVSLALRVASSASPAIAQAFPSEDAFSLGAAVFLHVVTYALACTIFYAAMLRLTGTVALSALLAVGLFLSPQFVAINIVRVDYLVMLPLMATFYCAVIVAQREDRLHHGIILGLSLGFLATLKISGLVFSLLPGLAAVSALRTWADMRRITRLAAVSGVVFAITYAVLMGRYLYHLTPSEIVELYVQTVALVRAWEVQARNLTAPFYYHIALMRGHGLAFIALYLASAAMVIWLAVTRRTPALMFLALCLVVFSAAAALTYKYPRGGYHLLPLFFAAIGLSAVAVLEIPVRRLRLGALTLGAAALLSNFAWSASFYRERLAEMEARPAAVQAVKRASQQWMARNVAPGTKICIQRDSNWTIPPIANLGVTLTSAPFDFPYLDPAAMARTTPPDLDKLPLVCDLIILAEWHWNFYNGEFAAISPSLAERWQAFYRVLRERHPPHVFASPTPAAGFYLGWVQIYDLRAAGAAIAARVCTDKASTIRLDGPLLPLGGHAYARKLPPWLEAAPPNEMQLCENDRLLGPGQALHDEIKNLGVGRFSFWNTYLYFATSDNSDPNSNGRTYRISAPNHPHPCSRYNEIGTRLEGPFVKEAGHSFLAKVPDRGLGTSEGAPQRTGSILCEDGAPLGPAEAVHDQIRTAGRGAYSHWGEHLYFSASDNSDPNTNGRSYTFMDAGAAK